MLHFLYLISDIIVNSHHHLQTIIFQEALTLGAPTGTIATGSTVGMVVASRKQQVPVACEVVCPYFISGFLTFRIFGSYAKFSPSQMNNFAYFFQTDAIH